MGKVRDHYGSQGDRNLEIPATAHIWAIGVPVPVCEVYYLSVEV